MKAAGFLAHAKRHPMKGKPMKMHNGDPISPAMLERAERLEEKKLDYNHLTSHGLIRQAPQV